MSEFDIAVVGGGPAGATFARLLSPKYKAIIIDRKGKNSSFRKPCGGLLAPDAQKALSKFNLTLPKEILVDPQIFSVRTIDLASGLNRYYQRFYLNLDRDKFDKWLLSLVPSNVEIERESVCTKILKEESGFTLLIENGGEKKEIKVKYLVGADGAGSIVRHTFFAGKKIRKYISIQEWFKEEHKNPFYSCIFDPENTDCYSWSISKDGYFIFGGAYAEKDARAKFEKQKEKLASIDFKFGEVVKREACQVFRPAGWREFCAGKDNIFLIGEAAGFISPSSLEGISSALNSARILAGVFNKDTDNKNKAYYRRTFPLRLKIFLKLFKVPFMYNPYLRKLIMKLGIKSIKLEN
ncbi:Dehydrogenase (flavoprotein) [Parelusimicrobium proximum]|uniref:FAD-binding protein n=1 Tax=Parelusimicrobium proximum TaxID=3228953 RepID=UPI003D18287C